MKLLKYILAVSALTLCAVSLSAQQGNQSIPAKGSAGTGCVPAGSAGQILTDTGSGGCNSVTALTNGTTATTQSAADNTTKVATDAFVLANGQVASCTSATGVAFQSGTNNNLTCSPDLLYSVTTGMIMRGNTTTAPAYTMCEIGGGCIIPDVLFYEDTSANGYMSVTGTGKFLELISGNIGLKLPTSAGSAGALLQTDGGSPQAGSWVTALSNGFTATTQTVGDNTTKVATDAFVLANGLTNPMTTPGDLIQGGTAGAAARLAVPTPPSGVSDFVCNNGSTNSFCVPGVAFDAQTAGSPYTIPSSDRSLLATISNASAYAVTLPASSATNFGNNFNMALANIGAGLVTITPTTSTINGNATQIVPNHWISYIYGDNTNYRAGTFPDIAAFPSCSSTHSALLFTSATGAIGCDTTSVQSGVDINTSDQVTATHLASGLPVNQGGSGQTSLTPTLIVASGTSAMGTGSIGSGACATVVTTTATGAATTDNVTADFNADPTSTTGYAPSATGMLTIVKYLTSGNVNFKVCNNTLASITPGAATLQWRVIR